MGKIHKCGVNYNVHARDNLYQYLLQRNITFGERDNYLNCDYSVALNEISNSFERKQLLEQKSQISAKLPNKRIPYTVIKIDNRAEQSLAKIHNILQYNFEYRSNIDFVDARKDDIFDFFSQRNININWLGELFGLDKNFVISELGCYASHIKALEYIVQNNIQEMIVFEDDIIISENFLNIFSVCYRDLPNDYDFLSDNTIFPNYEETSTNTENILTDSLYLNKPHLQNAMLCFMMYSLNGAEKLLSFIKKHGVLCPIDTLIFTLQRRNDLNGYATYYDNRLIAETNICGSFRDEV